MPESCRELMIVWKCGTKLAASKNVNISPQSSEQVAWGQELGMICTLIRMSSRSSGLVESTKSVFRPKKSKFKLLWRGLLSTSHTDSSIRLDNTEASVEPQQLGRWKLLASGKLDLGRLAAADERHETVELELRNRQSKLLGVLHLSVSSRRAAAAARPSAPAPH